MRRRAALFLVVTALVVANASLGVNVADGAVSCPGVTMTVAQRLKDGSSCTKMVSRDGHFTLDISSSGLSLEQGLSSTGVPTGFINVTVGTWSESSADGYVYSGLALVLRSSGDLVLVTPRGVVLWSTHTAGTGATHLGLQNNGRLVLRTAAGKAVWTSNSGFSGLGVGERVTTGQRLVDSTNYFAIHNGVRTTSTRIDTTTMQSNGDLVYRCSRGRVPVVWHTNTHVPGSYVVFQSNGEEVVRAPSGRALWATPTRGARYAWSTMGIMINAGTRTAWEGDTAPNNIGC